ncbi:Asx homology domain-containing protein [Lophiotrema nucula]|uniref:Asx homology domain-containing protein n=1 Tax=Lophiotrema nucula TaxID=690887 RepID=A0A6A5ZKH5_9PLEO|nr:Asx homology domain-containing protein [Lophiotrema nucula]
MALMARSSAQPSPTPEPTISIFDQPLPFDSHSHTSNVYDQSHIKETSLDDVPMPSPLSSPPNSPASSTTSKKRSAPDSDPTEGSPAKKRSSSKPEPTSTSSSAKKRTPPKPRPSPSTKATGAEAKMPAATRPRRDRKVPQKYNPDDFKEPPKAARPTRLASKIYDPIYATTNSQSRLVKADIYHLLCTPSAWTTLSASQQDFLLSKCPSTTANAGLRAQVVDGKSCVARPKELSEGKEIFRTDVAKFKTDLAAGHLAKTWQAEARLAVQERAEGKYDAWKERESERWWGEKAD